MTQHQTVRQLVHLGVMLLGFSMVGCDDVQDGQFVINSRVSVPLAGGRGRIDVLVGVPNPPSKSDINKPLATFVILSSETPMSEITTSGGDGPLVSAINIHFHDSGKPTFGYGAAWNRANDKVVIDRTEFKREEGDIFLVLLVDGKKELRQLRVKNSPVNVEELLSEIIRQTEGDAHLRFVNEAVKDASVKE